MTEIGLLRSDRLRHACDAPPPAEGLPPRLNGKAVAGSYM
jgi:hypothetical protein